MYILVLQLHHTSVTMLSLLSKLLKPHTQETDPFIKRLRSLVIGEGMLKEGNVRLMDYAIRHMPDHGCVLEIGSYGGLSTNLLTYLLSKHQRTHPLFTCDAWIYEGYTDYLKRVADVHIDGRPDVLRSTYSSYMKQAFIQSTTLLSSHRLPFSFHMHSAQFFDCWEQHQTATDVFGRSQTLGGEISFAYIDGGHSYEVAWNDFIHVTKHLVKGGFILFDDSADSDQFGSALMMKDIKKDKRFEVIAQNPNYLIRKLV